MIWFRMSIIAEFRLLSGIFKIFGLLVRWWSGEPQRKTSLRFGVQTLEYRDMRKRRRRDLGPPELRKDKKQECKPLGENEEKDFSEEERVAGGAFSLTADLLCERGSLNLQTR